MFRRRPSGTSAVDLPSIARWMPDGYILGLRAEGHGVGAIRHLLTASGAEISERLDGLDEAAGTIDLSILEPLPWGLSSYRAHATLAPVSQERCRLTWCGTFAADTDAIADRAARLLEKSYARLFLGLRREVTSRR